MINADMRTYNYYTFGKKDSYGQAAASQEPEGTIEIAINISSQATQENVLFKDCTYIGLTHDKNINDKYIIAFGNEKLKVQYVNNKGRYTQVYLKNFNG
jgi:hypothetical protein